MIEAALDIAIETALRSSTELAAVMGGRVRLYPLSAPNDAPFPHIIFGENQILPWDDPCTKGHEVYVTLRGWCQDNAGGPTATMAQAKRLAGTLRELLDQPLTISGHAVVDHRPETNRALPDADGLSALVVVEHRYWVEASA